MSGYFDGMGVSKLAEESWKALIGAMTGFRPNGPSKMNY